MLVRLAVIFRENFTEDKLTVLCCELPWNVHGTSFVCWQYFPWKCWQKWLNAAVIWDLMTLFIGPHRIHEIHTIATDDLGVCQSVSRGLTSLRHGWTDRGPAGGEGTWGPKEHCTRRGAPISHTDSTRLSPGYFDHVLVFCLFVCLSVCFW